MALIEDYTTSDELLNAIANAQREIFNAFRLPVNIMSPPEPGERPVWGETIWVGHGEGDDGGGAALAAYRFGRCSVIPVRGR